MRSEAEEVRTSRFEPVFTFTGPTGWEYDKDETTEVAIFEPSSGPVPNYSVEGREGP